MPRSDAVGRVCGYNGGTCHGGPCFFRPAEGAAQGVIICRDGELMLTRRFGTIAGRAGAVVPWQDSEPAGGTLAPTRRAKLRRPRLQLVGGNAVPNSVEA